VFTIERRGGVTIISPTNDVERFDAVDLEDAADLVTHPIRGTRGPLVVWDLSQVDFFGSSFLTLLLRAWKVVLIGGGQMALAGVSPRAKELLHLTSLDMLWPLYKDRSEAIESLQAD
jgi:anti-anti-sigma factor